MNVFELLFYWTPDRIYLQKGDDILGPEVQKWREIEDPSGNVTLMK